MAANSSSEPFAVCIAVMNSESSSCISGCSSGATMCTGSFRRFSRITHYIEQGKGIRLEALRREVKAITQKPIPSLAKMAEGSAIQAVRTVTEEGQLDDAARTLRETNGSVFVLLKVKPDYPPSVRGTWDASISKTRFREALLG